MEGCQVDGTDEVKAIVSDTGFSESGYIAIENLIYYPEIRKICEGNSCRSYAATWACPPAVGTLDECRARVNQYDRMLLFSKAYRLEDSFDFEGMENGLRDFKHRVDRLQDSMKDKFSEFLILSNEGCGRCSVCTYPDSPCRFPHFLHHSLEGYGFIVSELAKEAGIRYNNGPNTVTFFGALLFLTGEN